MKISVITPTYNRKDTLGKLYNSILNNLQCDIEIEWLIMDDGSTDGTEEYIQKFIPCSNSTGSKSFDNTDSSLL